MLLYLAIKDFGIFSGVELELSGGLSVFTGETGAGKSMIVDAVMACLGQRTSKDLIRSGAKRASVELLAYKPPEVEHPSIGEDSEISLQRDILPDRSYIKANGKVITSGMAQDIGAYLVDIHGQQEQHSLTRPQYYLQVLDSLKKDEIEAAKNKYHACYEERQATLKSIDRLGESGAQRQKQIDLLSYQVKEITDAGLRDGEEEELKAEFAVLSSQKRLVELVDQAYAFLYQGEAGTISAAESMSNAIYLLGKVSAIDSSITPSREALAQVSYGLETALDLVRAYRRSLDVSPDRLDLVSDRLDLIMRLKAKYGNSVKAIIEFGQTAENRLYELMNSQETLAGLRESLKSVESRMASMALGLTRLRRKVADDMETQVSLTLGELGMPGARFAVVLDAEEDILGISGYVEESGRQKESKVRVFPDGWDRVSLLFTANPGEPPLSVHRVASGGELSRLMLAIKAHLGEVDPVPTLIFDEIDAGVGGKAGQAVAEMLWKVGQKHQVLCVTHLATIAAIADNHYLVEKHEKGGRTFASVKMLSDKERISEISRMLSGDGLSISKQHAEALLKTASEFKEVLRPKPL